MTSLKAIEFNCVSVCNAPICPTARFTIVRGLSQLYIMASEQINCCPWIIPYFSRDSTWNKKLSLIHFEHLHSVSPRGLLRGNSGEQAKVHGRSSHVDRPTTPSTWVTAAPHSVSSLPAHQAKRSGSVTPHTHRLFARRKLHRGVTPHTHCLLTRRKLQVVLSSPRVFRGFPEHLLRRRMAFSVDQNFSLNQQ